MQYQKNSKVEPIIFVIIFLIQYLNLFIFDTPYQVLISNLMQVASGLYASILVTRAYKFLKSVDSIEQNGWFFFTIATYLWVIGASIFLFYEVILKVKPYPSIADLFYLSFYPTIIIGFLKLPKNKIDTNKRIDTIIDLITLVLSGSLVVWLLGFQEVILKLIYAPQLDTLFSFLYIMFDISILFVSFHFLATRMQFKTYAYPIIYFIAGCYFLIFGDLIQGLITTFANFTSGGVADIGWVTFSLFLGLSGFKTRKNQNNTSIPPKASFFTSDQRSISILLLTYFWLLLALITLIWTLIINKNYSLYIIIPSTFTILLLVLYRQIKIIKEKSELTLELMKTQDNLEVSNEELMALNQNLASESMKLVNLNDRLLQSEEMLIEANESKNKFFSIIAHDLRNPVAAFSQLTELLHLHFKSMTQSEAEEIIDALSKSARFTSELLTNLLDWSQTQTNTIDFSPNSINIYEIVEKVIRVLSLQSRNKNIEIINNLPHVIILNVDREMITTVLRNLISNSIKFTEPNGQIILSANVIHESVSIEIKDTGVGMTPETISKLFQIKHKQNKVGTNNEKGTGLGLIICKEFVERHNGTIHVESTPNVGTSFFINLPKDN